MGALRARGEPRAATEPSSVALAGLTSIGYVAPVDISADRYRPDVRAD